MTFDPFTSTSGFEADGPGFWMNQEALANHVELFELLGLVKPGTAIRDSDDRRNSFLLARGEYLSLRLSKDDTLIDAATPGAVVTKHSLITGCRQVRGVTFRLEDVTQPYLITFGGATGRMEFINCIFERAAAQTSRMFDVTTGWKLNFTNCWFIGGDGVDTVFRHAGAAGNILTVGGSNTTGAALGNATAFHTI